MGPSRPGGACASEAARGGGRRSRSAVKCVGAFPTWSSPGPGAQATLVLGEEPSLVNTASALLLCPRVGWVWGFRGALSWPRRPGSPRNTHCLFSHPLLSCAPQGSVLSGLSVALGGCHREGRVLGAAVASALGILSGRLQVLPELSTPGFCWGPASSWGQALS